MLQHLEFVEAYITCNGVLLAKTELTETALPTPWVVLSTYWVV